jgi:hypothetical protein
MTYRSGGESGIQDMVSTGCRALQHIAKTSVSKSRRLFDLSAVFPDFMRLKPCAKIPISADFVSHVSRSFALDQWGALSTLFCFLVRWVKVGTLSAPGVLSALDINSRQFGLNEGESHQRPLLNI